MKRHNRAEALTPRLFSILALLLFLGPISPISGQLSFEPVSVVLSPEGPESSVSFRLGNTGGEPIAVRLEMLSRTLQPDGSEIAEPLEEGLFALFPSRLVLESGEQRSVRLSYQGEPSLERERSFRILAEQVPVDFSREPRSSGGNSPSPCGTSGRSMCAPRGWNRRWR